MSIIKRSRTLYLRKRVPRRYGRVEPREFVVVSLHTDSMQAAKVKEVQVWADLVESWEARLAGDTEDAEARLAAAKDLAAAKGFRFMRAREVEKLPRAELRARVNAAKAGTVEGDRDLMSADAFLGTAPLPKLTVETALETYWRVARDKILGKSDDQVRRWRNPRKKAVSNFVDLVGNKLIVDVTTDDLFQFREWWVDRLAAEGLTPNSANKDFVHLVSMMRTVARSRGLILGFSTEGLMLKQGEKRQRPAFSTEWIREKLLAPGALAGLNTEARCIVLGMVNTGYRPSEAQGLTRDQIHLDAEVPHISIEPVGRTLKSAYSRRKIPLLGVSLEAFRECPDGFPRYRDKPGLSDTVNKFLRENGLLETPGHSLYSLRHAFEDRMLAAGIDDRIRRDLFGHRLTRERYGHGASQAHLAQVLAVISL